MAKKLTHDEEHNPQFMRSLHHEFSSTIDIALSSNAVRLARRAPIELGPYDRIAFLRFRKTASSAVIKVSYSVCPPELKKLAPILLSCNL